MKTTPLTLVLLLLVATAVAQIQDQGLQKGVDEFAGTIICEQQVYRYRGSRQTHPKSSPG